MQKDITYQSLDSEESRKSSDVYPFVSVSHTKISITRMESALESRTIPLPIGMTREEKRNFILSHALDA